MNDKEYTNEFLFTMLLCGVLFCAAYWAGAGNISSVLGSIRFMLLLTLSSIMLIISVVRQSRYQNRKYIRKHALNLVSAYLAPYDNIWGNLRLSNEYCILKLEEDGVTIAGIERNANPYRTFKTVIPSPKNNEKDIWSTFCLTFLCDTTYEDLKSFFSSYTSKIDENTVTNKNAALDKDIPRIEPNSTLIPLEKTDINNCSFVELMVLPGVGCLAEKIIKKREDTGGFKSVEEFLRYINVSPHYENQLRKLIYISREDQDKEPERADERNIDL